MTHLPGDRNLAQSFRGADRLSSSGLTQPIVFIRLLQDELPVRRKRRLKIITKCISNSLIRMESATTTAQCKKVQLQGVPLIIRKSVYVI